MRLNIFSVPKSEVEALESKLPAAWTSLKRSITTVGTVCSTIPPILPLEGGGVGRDVPELLSGSEPSGEPHLLRSFLLTKSSSCYALSYGKAHFYVRPYSDHDFGIELAKRIANEADMRQTASRRFEGRRRKDIRSYASNTALDVESGESVDYLQAGIIPDHRETFSKTGKFGTSALVLPDIELSELGEFLDKLEDQLSRPARFALPRTTLISEKDEAQRYDELLLDELTAEVGTTDFVHNSYDLYGIDFVFSSAGSFTLYCPRAPELTLDELSMRDLKLYIRDNKIPRQDIFKIKITHEQEGWPIYTQGIKQALDFIGDDDRVLLSNGWWMRFNQDYLDFLDDYLSSILVEDTELGFRDIDITEPEFNTSEEARWRLRGC